MRRAAIIAAGILAAGLPLLVATVYYFGCCVLPFHGVIHKLMPLCTLAINALHADHHDGDAVPPPKPAKRITGVAPHASRLASLDAKRTDPVARPVSYRDFIAHGAVRCDHDVGLHLLVATFRI